MAVNVAIQMDCNRSQIWAGFFPARIDVGCWWTLVLLVTISWVGITPASLCAAQKYYYIHVGSFRAKKNAVKVASGLKESGYGAVVAGENVQNKGYWYRIYVGPISSLQQAKLQSSELKKKGLAKYAAIYKKSFVRDESEKTISGARKAAPMAAATAGMKVSRPPKTAPSVSKKPPALQSGKQKAPAAKKAPTSISPVKESQKLAYQPPELDSKIKKKPADMTPQLQRRGYGQNIPGRKLSLSLRHTYREVQTELTDRDRVTSNGVTTSRQKVQVPSSEKNDFDTQMNLTMLRMGFGLTDFLQIFGDVGVCYDHFEDFNLAYGGGARLNLYEAKSGGLKGFYASLQAEYHGGKLETDYQSVQGNKFSKEADWWDFTTKAEIGFTRNRFSVYAGGTYFIYREDTDRKQKENLPPGLTLVKFEDDLEEENNVGAYGGISFYLTPGLLFNLEGQVIAQNSISAAIEYRF